MELTSWEMQTCSSDERVLRLLAELHRECATELRATNALAYKPAIERHLNRASELENPLGKDNEKHAQRV